MKLKNILTTISIVFVLVMTMLFSLIAYNMVGLVSLLENKIDIYEYQRQEQITKILDTLKDVAKLSNINDLSQLALIESIIENIKSLDEKQIEIAKKLKGLKPYSLDNVENIKKANVYIKNTTQNIGGAGTHIKIDNKSYILSVAHSIIEDGDILWAITDEGIYYPLELVKVDKKRDLALFKTYDIGDLPYLEISDETPKEGSEIIVIGNPDGLTDIITNGVIAKVQKNGYLFTNVIFFGNSGGAVLYKGKIVGVVSQMIVYIEESAVVNYGYCSKLEVIKEFLGI